MSGLFKSSSSTPPQSQDVPKFSGISVQTSVYGKCIPIVFGATRIAPNLIGYWDFTAIPHATTSGGGGGKGGVFGPGGSNAAVSISYTYTAAVAMALCEGPVSGVGNCYQNKSVQNAIEMGFTEFTGTYTQTPWTYLTTNHPSSAFGYRGVAYVAQAGFDLGSSAQLANHNFEVFGFHYHSVSATIPDADPSLIVTDLLTDPHFGLPGFTWLGDLTDFKNYTLAMSLYLSPAYESQTSLSSMLEDIAKATNSECLFSNGTFRLIPRGDAQVTGNGHTYVPPDAVYDLTDDDFLPSSGAAGTTGGTVSSPILVSRKRISDAYNSIQWEILDRTANYNKTLVEAKDQFSIDQYGLRQDTSSQMHLIADTAVGYLAVQLALQKQSILNTYTWSTDLRYVLLEPMDIVTLTHSAQGLNRQPVRITEIEEVNGTLQFTAEDYLGGVGDAARYSFATGQGFATNFNVDPGNADEPLFFEPTDELWGGLFVALATSGGSNWGGCEVWVATDPNSTFQRVATMYGPSRHGTLTAPLNSVTRAVSGPTIDASHMLSVDIGTTGQLLNASHDEATSLNTLCYVDGEYIAYSDSTLTAAGKYNLGYLVRGALGTSITSHASGSKFARIDNGLGKVPFTQDRIGTNIYIKLLSFNIYGSARQNLADVSAYTYQLQGTALSSPLPNVTNVRQVFEAGFQKIWWDEVVDFRSDIRYKVSRGDTYVGSQELGTLAHPPFIAFGDGTYWITAYCQPVAGLIVYSETPQSIVIAGNMLIANLVITSDLKAQGWPGTFDNTALEGSPGSQTLRLVGQENVLTEPDILNLPDVLNSGGIVPSGTFEIAGSDYVDVGYLAQCNINASWQAVGSPVGSNVLTITDFLNTPDVLGSASTAFIDAWVEIATSPTGPGDLYTSGDLYAEGDLYFAPIAWSAWQRFVPGVYSCRVAKMRLVLQTVDSQTICYVLSFSFDVSVPPRIDHYPTFDVPVGGTTVTFEPDNADTAAPFNGGPPVGGTVHNQPLPFYSISAPNAAGLTPVIDALSLASMTFHWENSTGTHVAVPQTSLIVEGY